MAITDYLRFRRLALEGFWILSGQVAAVIGALVLVRVLTEYLEPEQYGQLTLGLTIAGLVNQVVMGGVTAGISRFYSIAAEKNELPQYLNASQRLMVYAIISVGILVFTTVVGLLWFGESEWIVLVVAALTLSVLNGCSASLGGIQNAARHRSVVALHGGVEPWLRILLAVGMMIWLGSSSTAVILGYALSSLIVTGSQLLFLQKLIRPEGAITHMSRDWGQKIWAYSWPFSVFGVFT
jgi:O-antigen/teichoic acid export membrane protein